MSSELVSTYSGLGVRDGEEYFRGEECLACVKDLIRALRGDDGSCEIRRQLGKAQVLQKDLMPLLVHYSNDDVQLRNDVIRLLVNLTQPAYLCFGEKFPGKKDVETMKCYMEVSQYLRQYKEEFAVERVMHILGTLLADLCQKDWEDREDDDVIIIERVLLLIRNVLHVPASAEEEKRTEDDVSLHDKILWNLHINGIDELIVFLGSNPNEGQWCMYVIEIVFLMLKEQSPSNLATAGQTRSHKEKRRDEKKIEELLSSEEWEKVKARQHRGLRHSNFGGSFTVSAQITISGRERVHHLPLAGINNFSFDTEKRPRRTPKQRRLISDPQKERLSTLSVRLVLKNFCVQLLECGYNYFMRVVRDNIKRQRSMENDETYYLWVMRFLMEFSRLHSFSVDIVSETLQLPTLHYVLQLMASSFENMVLNKRERELALAWSHRLHFAVQAYKELLLHIQEMASSSQEGMRETANIILGNILYHPEYREIFITLLRNYNEAVQPVAFLRDVVEMAHVYIKLTEHYCKSHGSVLVKKKKKIGAKRKPKRSEEYLIMTEEQLLHKWDAMKEELVGIVSSEATPTHGDVSLPFDAASDQPLEEQKLVTMGRIYQQLCSGDLWGGVALARAAREVWPDEGFGSINMGTEQEVESLRLLLFNPSSAMLAARELEDGDDYNEEGEEEEIREVESRSYELEFDMKKFTYLFINNKIVRAYCQVLDGFSTNTDLVNHATVKMLHKIAVGHNMAPMLYQISVFRTLMKILNEPSLPRFRELQKFARYIVNGFFRLAANNPLLFAELLVWRTSGECYELVEGYGTREKEKERMKNRTVWSREQEAELAELFHRFRNEYDVVGCIEAALPSDLHRSRKIIASQIVKQGLVGSRQELQKKPKKRKSGEWSEEETFTLQSVWQLPEDGDINEAVRQLSHYFPERGLRDIKQQLQVLGLVPTKQSSSERQRRGNPDTQPPLLGVGSDREEQEWDPLIEGDFMAAPRNAKTKQPLRHTMHPRHTGENIKGDVGKLVRSLHRQGFSEQLAWLATYITDEARDREMDDEWEEMCIVAVEKKTAEALDTQDLRDLMLLVGLTPPSEQEVYWRIPPYLGPAQLLEAAEKISLSLSCMEEDKDQDDTTPTAHCSHKTLEAERETPHHPRFQDSSSDEEERLEIVMPSNEDLHATSESEREKPDSDHESDEAEMTVEQSLALLKKQRSNSSRNKEPSGSLSPHTKKPRLDPILEVERPKLSTRSQFLSDDESDLELVDTSRVSDISNSNRRVDRPYRRQVLQDSDSEEEL